MTFQRVTHSKLRVTPDRKRRLNGRLKMNRCITLAIGVMLVAGTAIDAAAHGRRHGANKVSLTELLELTETQEAELTEIRTAFSERRQAIKEEYRAEFEAILSADQLEALADLKESGEKRHRRAPLSEVLQLSEDQLTQKIELRSARMEEMQVLREEYKAAFEAALTAEQLATLEEVRASFPRHRKKERRDGGDVAGAEEDPPADIDTGESVETSFEVSAISATTAVEETSWGGVKSLLAR